MVQQETKIPTAEEFFKDIPTGSSDIEYWAKEFTKLHVEAALKSAYNNIEYTTEDSSVPYVVEESILNAYPLTNIK